MKEYLIQILIRVYLLLLKLYPQAYRAEYNEELETVFKLAIYEAVNDGGFSAIWMGLRELRDLPRAIILAHWRELRKQKMAAERGSFFNIEAGSRREAIVALAPFLLFGAFSTFLSYIQTSIPDWFEVAISFIYIGLMVSLFIIGILKRFPRWFLPYLGLPLPLFSAYIFLDLIASPPYEPWLVSTSPWLLRVTVSQGLLWAGLLLTGVMIVLISGILPPLRSFYWRLRRDWTLLSFILYGSALFALLFTFDDYINEEPYKIVAMMFLGIGGWFYLQSDRPWQRMLALLTGLTLAMAVAAVGKAILYSTSSPYPHGFTWYTEAMSTVIMWLWLAMAISEPVLLNLLPYPSGSVES